MEASEFHVLDLAVRAGGVNLGSAALGGKKAAATVSKLCESGLLTKGGGKTPKYTLTDRGRSAWEQQAPEDARRELARRREEERTKVLTDFLRLVAAKDGKSFTAAEAKKFPESIATAREAKLIEPGTEAGSYRLLPTGEAHLLAAAPLVEQLDQLRRLVQQTAARFRTFAEGVRRELDGLDTVVFAAATAELNRRIETACRTFDSVVAEVEAHATLAAAARRFRDHVAAAAESARAGAEAKAAALGEKVKADAERLADFEQRTNERLNQLAERAGARRPTGGSAGTPATSDSAVWEATRTAYQHLRDERATVGQSVTVPELADAVTAAHPDVAVPRLHALLQRWQAEDRLTLRVCNDPRLEPRAGEGIQSPDGLRFYVRIH